MLKRPLAWFALSLLCLGGAWLAWQWGDSRMAARKQATGAAATSTPSPAVRAESSTVTPASSTIPSINSATPGRIATNTSALKFRLTNSALPYAELLRADHAILLENAAYDTRNAARPEIPSHLHSTEPGAYIVQARGPVTDSFRRTLKQAGAEIISYIPNNAFLVRASAAAAAQLQSSPQTQSLLAYEPYYKVLSTLLPLAVNRETLPEDALLNVVLFNDAAASTTASIQKLGAHILSEDRTPFGPMLRVKPAPDSLVALAGLGGVQIIERASDRVRANDLARFRIGVATNSLTTASNHLLLTGANILVGVVDEGVDPAFPDLLGRVLGDIPRSLRDFSGHGTHVATSIAGNGSQSLTVTNPPQGSEIGADFRGVAPAARIFSMLYQGTNPPNTPFLPDTYLQEVVSRTNVFIVNNSWGYVNDNSYSITAASYDAAVRDAQPGTTGSQPLVYVFAAGNAGAGNDVGKGGDAGSITSPGTAKNVITVGALEQLRDITNSILTDCVTNLVNVTNGLNVTVTTNIVCVTNQPFAAATDSLSQVASYSSRGNVGIGSEGDFGRYKPDVVAPGTMVVSGRSTQWDQTNYYDPSSVINNTFRNVDLAPGANFLNILFVPDTAVSVRIRIFQNEASPTPFPPTPIFVRQPGPPTSTSAVATNQFNMPGNLPLTPVGTTWFYRVINTSTQSLNFDVVTTITVVDDVGGEKELLRGLNDAIAPNYRYESGTSMAAAQVSGTLALMQQFFEGEFQTKVSPALLKASLINGALPAGPGYDFASDAAINFQGWGAINLDRSLPVGITNGFPKGVGTRGAASVQYFDQTPLTALATAQSQTRTFKVSTNSQSLPLRATLVWTDPPGNPAASVKLVNDLDLVVTNLDTGDVYFGNRFFSGASFTEAWDTNELFSVDVINNVENVFIAPPIGTNYSVTVRGKRVNVNAVTANPDDTVQDYALVVSVGGGQVPESLTLQSEPPKLGLLAPDITIVTNTFVGAEASGFLLGNQLAGANTPLLGTTNGITNQWHFYIVTNTTEFTNAAFVTFLPTELSMPRLGVRETDEDNGARLEADIDLYVSTDPGLLQLNPTVINNALKSTKRGGTEQVILSNSVQNQVYFIGVKAEDQMAAEYALFGVFSLFPFDSADGTVRCYPAGQIIPDRSPESVSKLSDVAVLVCPCGLDGQTRRVVATNIITHENLGDLISVLSHNEEFATLKNHRPPPLLPDAPGPYFNIYEDNGEFIPATAPYQIVKTDGPGSLRDFTGTERLGPWIFTCVDDALSQTGLVNNVSLLVEEQSIDGTDDRFLPPLSFTFDFIDVPSDATNLQVCVAGNTLPVELYIKRGSFPGLNDYDYFTTIPAAGGCFNITPQDLPPLSFGRYYIGVYNPNGSAQTLRLTAVITRAPGTDNSLKFTSSTEIPIIDDGVTYASLFNNNFGRVGDVKVSLRIDHPRISDLAITLISPQGTRILLAENRGRTNTLGFGSSFGVTNVVPVSSSGGPEAVTNIIETGTTEGFVLIDYNFFCAEDRMTIYYDGARIFDSGYVNNSCPPDPNARKQIQINYGPGFTTRLVIVMNEGGNPRNATQWEYTASAIQFGYNYVIFTEDTELTTTPIKFGVPPFVPTGVTSNFLFSTFDATLVNNYFAPAVVDGWNLISNRVEVLNDPALVNSGLNSAAMHTGTLQRDLGTKKGRTYSLQYAYRRNSLFDGLVSWWPAENNFEDVVDGNGGFPVGNVRFGNGLVGKTFVLDGDGDAVNVGTNANLQLQNFSIEGWIRRSSASVISFNGNGGAEIFAVGEGGGGFGFYLRPDAALALGKLQVNESLSPFTITDTNWHHVAVTKSGTTVVFYMDGVAFTAPPYVSTGFTFTQSAYIGGWRNPSGVIDNSLFGEIDELSVYNRPLTATEIAAIVAAGSAGKCVPTLPPVVRPWNSAALGFSTNSNPNGVWTYGYSASLGGALTPFTESGSTGALEFWRTNISAGVPNATYNPSLQTVTNGSASLRPFQLAVHPGTNGEVSVIRYTCTNSDVYRVSAIFSGADFTGPTTTDIHVLFNGVSIFDGIVSEFGSGPSFETNLTLNAGQFIDFVVGYGTNNTFALDTTALSAVVVPVAGCPTSPTFVTAGGVTNQIKGGTEWLTNAVVFVASTNTTPVTIYSPDGESDVLVDSFVIREPPDGLYFLPEESLKALEGEIAYGEWRLEILDTRVGATLPQPKLLSWQLDFLYQEVLTQPGRLVSGDCNTASVPPGEIRYYAIDVPSFVRAVTNRITFASGPVDLLFNQTIPPTGTNAVPPDYRLLTNATSGSYTLTTNAAAAPVLIPGQRYFLGVQNKFTTNVTFTLCIDFDLASFPDVVDLTNGIPFCTVNSGPSNPLDYYRFVVSTNSRRAQFELTALTDDLTLILRQGLPPTLSVFDFLSANAFTNDEVITVFDFSQPVPLTPGDWYFAAANFTAGPIGYCATAREWFTYGTNITIVNTFVQSNSFCITWTSLDGVPYHVEGKTSLSDTNWAIVSPTVRGTGNFTTWCLPLPSPFQFFRVVEGIVINPYVPPPKFSSIQRVPNGYQLKWNGPTNQLYEVQWTTNIAPSNWLPFAPPVGSTTGAFGFLDDGSQTGGLFTQRFYRLRLWP
jgi:subtilisin-like proprotein convertase family protein